MTPGVLRRQSGMLNVREALNQDPNPLDTWKDARITHPFHNELVDGILKDKSECVLCRYDHKKKQWINEDGDKIDVAIWRIPG